MAAAICSSRSWPPESRLTGSRRSWPITPQLEQGDALLAGLSAAHAA